MIYGRRRIGKTYLIQNTFSNKNIYFECSGVKDGNMHDQLKNFNKSFGDTFYPGINLQPPQNWSHAFEMLNNEIEKLDKTKKITIFLDELPWLATNKSSLIQNLDYIWNSSWSKKSNLLLIVCGSAASWMLSKLINAKGGLHNRITRSILLKPFNLTETKNIYNIRKLRSISSKSLKYI